jgi:hypothetical protein
MGHDELHVVAGSDRVKEMDQLLHRYNGVKGKHGYYNFKKIRIHSAGHRDPDAEGAEGMSGTKMREHAKNKDFSSFRQGVPHHVSDEHAKELMHDVRKGMGLNESFDRGLFKAIFITGGPGSGKDVIIREAIASQKSTEFNFTQVLDILNDKHKLAMKSMNPKYESIRTRGPLIINGPADDIQKINQIKEELESLGYITSMIFVNTTDEVSRERNSHLNRVVSESIRQDKWEKSQKNIINFKEMFNELITFDNTGNLDTKEEDIHNVYQFCEKFLDKKITNEVSEDWLVRNNSRIQEIVRTSLYKEGNNVKKDSKSTQTQTVRKYNPSFRAAGPADIPADNRASDPSSGDIKWDGGKTGAKRGSYIFRTYESKTPTLKINPLPKEPNFQQDKEKTKGLKKKTFNDVMSGSKNQGNGIGDTYSSRSGLGMGLGPQMSEQKTLKQFLEAMDSPGETALMGVSGVAGSSTNKEPMQTYGDKNRMGILIDKKKKKRMY